MKPTFHQRLLNDYFEDPCLLVRMIRDKGILLFDVGDIRALGTSEIYRISDIFVTHTHIDHFIGFDTVLRTILRRDLPLNVYGPKGIISRIAGKLKGYSWNLIREYPTVINVSSYDGKTVTRAVFKAADGFSKKICSPSKSDGILLKTPVFRIRAAVMDHHIPCLAYSIEEEFHINIDKERLSKRGLKVGPWLSELKKAIREKSPSTETLTIDGKDYPLGHLIDIATVSKGQKITYATDLSMNKKNIARLIELAKDSDTFYCEAYFLEKDRQRALDRFHLTAKTCGLIAREAGVKKLALMHFSPKYRDCPDLVIREAMAEFTGPATFKKKP